MKQKLSSFRLFSHRKMEFKLTWQYFLIWDKSFSISFLPISSFHLRQALVKAFFLDLLLLRFVKINTLSRIGTSSKSRQVANQELNRAEKYFSYMFKMPRLTKNSILRGRVQISRLHRSLKTREETEFAHFRWKSELFQDKDQKWNLTSSCRSDACTQHWYARPKLFSRHEDHEESQCTQPCRRQPMEEFRG